MPEPDFTAAIDRAFTTEQLLALTEYAHALVKAAYYASASVFDKNTHLNRVALNARRIAEIAIPEDLRYRP